MIVSYNAYKDCLKKLPEANSFVNDTFFFQIDPINGEELCFYKNFDAKKGYYWQCLTDISFTHDKMCPVKQIPVDKESGGISYNDLKHVYWNNTTGEYFTSVTTLVKKFYTPFDSDLFSMYKAIESIMGLDQFKKFKYRKTPKQVVESFKELTSNNVSYYTMVVAKASNIAMDWFVDGQQSALFGTNKHKEKEDLIRASNFDKATHFYGRENLQKFLGVCFSKNTRLFPEVLIGSIFYKVAGQIDLLLLDKDAKTFWLFDYKTNKVLKSENPYQKMLGVCSAYDDCELSHYYFQLSLYALMFSLKTGYYCGGLYLDHIKRDNTSTLIPVPYLDLIAKQMLESNLCQEIQ